MKYEEFVERSFKGLKADLTKGSLKPMWDGVKFLTRDTHTNIRVIDLSSQRPKLKELPFQFPEVWEGGFYCHNNSLTSLDGVPSVIHGNFTCGNNKLDSMVGGPVEVKGNYNAIDNKITNLSGAPEVVGGRLNLTGNPITDSAGLSKIKGTVIK